VLAEMETDKAIIEIPSPKTGTIAKLLHKEGDTVKVGEVLLLIAEVSEGKKTASDSDHYTASVVGQLEEAEELEVPKVTETRIESTPHDHPSHVAATPAVKRLARDMHVDISKLTGTGHEARITEEDIRKAASNQGREEIQPAVTISKKYDFFGYVERAPLKGVRKAVADHMVKSFTTAVHVTHMDEADVTELVTIREKEKAKVKEKLTYLPFIIKAVIDALKQYPMLNATLDDEHQEIIMKKYYNIGIAVATEDGLIVPVVKNAQNKTIIQIAKEIEELADKARSRKLDIMDMKGGTFTITNVGSLSGLYATPVINWPEAAILALGRIYDKVVFKDDKIVVRKTLPFSVTFDHRIIDGAECARFADTLKKILEDPNLIMIE
ncbi:MAG: dihydrolipoamide acetyltransferase family protein, partial [Candidatus Aenigmarchaeota archaeon]|nr:dihydrolipoamide acetyltransferase family protein [Candidatus Aenigmarchaeota archaeon]